LSLISRLLLHLLRLALPFTAATASGFQDVWSQARLLGDAADEADISEPEKRGHLLERAAFVGKEANDVIDVDRMRTPPAFSSGLVVEAGEAVGDAT